MTDPDYWVPYLPCDVCKQQAGQPCVRLSGLVLTDAGYKRVLVLCETAHSSRPTTKCKDGIARQAAPRKPRQPSSPAAPKDLLNARQTTARRASQQTIIDSWTALADQKRSNRP